jgi:prepilin-type N-terminal cleavage/methylation domain-containing protein
MRMKRKAFTLVELLVVIAIIALLIAIMAPSLKAARDLAKSTYCMSTLNSLNKSALVYAEGNRGYLMVYKHDFTLGYIEASADPWKTYVCFGSGAKDPKTGLFSDARGFGIVYASGLLGPPEMFYCPDQDDVRMTLANYPKPWGTAIGDGSNLIRNSYHYNPWVTRIPGGGEGQYTYEDALMVSRHPTSRFLTSDLMDRWDSLSHTTANSASWNMGYTDGHVEKFEDKQLYNMFYAGADFHNRWIDWDSEATGLRPHLPGAK